MATAPITVGLPRSPVWAPQAHSWNMSVPEQIRVSYARTAALAKHVDMTVKDIMELSPKFWKFHSDYTRNIKTTATLNQDSSLDLHTPVSHAAKVIPPTTPYARMARLAVVFAQLIVKGEQRSVQPFIARINTANSTMVPGVVLSPGHSWGGLIGSEDPRKDIFGHIQRVTVGTLSLSLTHIPLLRLMAYIAGKYSQRRTVASANPAQRVPIISFSTQYSPILTALTFASVLEAFGQQIYQSFAKQNPRVKSGLAYVFKQTAFSAGETLYNEMIERCGWQGLYGHNQMIEMAMCIRGNSVAEGDKLVLCIRLVSELLLNRYELPKPWNPKGLLAQHEASLWKKASRASKNIMVFPGSNRSEAFNQLLLPQCTNLVKTVGHRMAYEAAAASDTVSTEILDLFEASCILQDSSWYVEHKKLTISRMHKRHAEALNALLPKLDMMLEQTRAAPWVTAPLLKEADWDDFIEGLPTFSYKGEIPPVIAQEPSTPESEVTLRENSLGSQTAANVLNNKLGQSPEAYSNESVIPSRPGVVENRKGDRFTRLREAIRLISSYH
ncbi:hypothetical protein NM208_g2916 [Fusarium decemcellulare]|uniref:Uncharacterized protein n=1 Tax=Fusarium decemcellulare TaxID=57161 RepID=A0ACC1SQU2_9HYPO|nr:hypothetical protein NM208_g2916 [Fusarium decemcellulare]